MSSRNHIDLNNNNEKGKKREQHYQMSPAWQQLQLLQNMIRRSADDMNAPPQDQNVVTHSSAGAANTVLPTVLINLCPSSFTGTNANRTMKDFSQNPKDDSGTDQQQTMSVEVLRKENTLLRKELNEWKGRALYLEHAVKGLERSNKELKLELGSAKNGLLQWEKKCEEDCQKRDREVNRIRSIMQFEEEGRHAQTMAAASFADPLPLSADEGERRALLKRLPPPLKRVTIQAGPPTIIPYDSPGTSSSSKAAAEVVVSSSAKSSSFPNFQSVFGDFMPVPRHRRKTSSIVSSNMMSTGKSKNQTEMDPNSMPSVAPPKPIVPNLKRKSSD